MTELLLKTVPGFDGVLGLTKTADGFQAAVETKQAEDVRLRLYDKDKETIVQEIVFPRESYIGEVASVRLPGLKKFPWYYTFVLDGVLTPDPYAGVICGRETFGTDKVEGVLCGYLPPAEFQGDRPYRAAKDTLLYKLHVRGLTKHASSGVSRKGTFTGVKEKLPYLKSLGVTSLLLMPCYDFLERVPGKAVSKYETDTKEEEESRVNFWGYMGGFYFAPKASYCATSNPQKEFAQLVSACHENGMDLYMEFFFGRDCTAQLIRRVLYFWKQQYGVDGFSIVGDRIPVEELAKDPVFAHTRLMFSYADEHMYGNEKPSLRHVATMNNGFQCCIRSILKSDENQLKGFIEKNKRNPQNVEVINYVANHDGFTLADTVSYDFRHNDANGEANRDGSSQNFSWNCGEEGLSNKKLVNTLRYHQKRNAMLMLLLSQGIPLLYAGDELGNSQQGNNNAWCQDNEIGWVEYSRKKADKEFLQFVKDAVAFRKAHPVFSMEKQPRNTDYLAKGVPDLSYHSDRAWFVGTEPADRGVGMLYNGAYEKDETEEYIYVIYNMYWDKASYALPSLPGHRKWCLTADTSTMQTFIPAGQEQPVENQKMAEVPGRCIQIFCARKCEEPEEKPVRKAGKKNRTKRQGVSRKDCADTEDKVKSVDKVALEAAEKAVAEENRQSAAKASAEEKIKATENAGTASEQSPAVGEVQEHE